LELRIESHQAQEAVNWHQKRYYCVQTNLLAMSMEVPIACPIVSVDGEPGILQDMTREIRMAKD
jgi:hypothetical protein